jgi:hypothetical protein
VITEFDDKFIFKMILNHGTEIYDFVIGRIFWCYRNMICIIIVGKQYVMIKSHFEVHLD